MTWLDAEDMKWYIEMVDDFLETRSNRLKAGRAEARAEKKLMDAMIGVELDEIHRKGSTIRVELPDEGDVYLSVNPRGVLDLGGEEA